MRIDRMRAGTLLAFLLAALPLGGASAQLRPDPAQRPEPAPQTAPGNPNAAPPERVAPAPGGAEDSGGSGANLSDRLSRSQGTIKPPADVDPGMAAAPPDTGRGSLRVIPPPGSPENNPTVKPK